MKILNDWFQQPLGKAVIESIQKQWESSELSSLPIYGECLQIGTDVPLLTMKNRVKKTHVLTSEYIPDTHVIASVKALPFVQESFSMIVLPFTLEYSHNPLALLDEVKRVLTPDGIVCVIGINPLSLWGGARLFSSKAVWPINKFYWHSSLRVYASLVSRHFHLHEIKSFFYRPPFSSSILLEKTRFLESVGQMFWPYPGGLYFLLAQKVTTQFLTVESLWQTGGYVFGKA